MFKLFHISNIHYVLFAYWVYIQNIPILETETEFEEVLIFLSFFLEEIV